MHFLPGFDATHPREGSVTWLTIEEMKMILRCNSPPRGVGNTSHIRQPVSVLRDATHPREGSVTGSFIPSTIFTMDATHPREGSVTKFLLYINLSGCISPPQGVGN